jgi:hypothetical protein
MPAITVQDRQIRSFTREQPVDELIREALAQIPSAFGKLAYTARSRHASNGRYRHDGLALTHDWQEINAVLKSAHEQAWLAWLSLTLEEQMSDLHVYMAGLNLQRVIPAWKQSQPWTAMAPAGAGAHEKRLFELDFEKILVLLEATLKS